MRRALAFDTFAFLLAWAATSAPFSRDWIEYQYANGIFAWMNRAFVPLSERVPFAAGDLEGIVAIVLLMWWWVRTIRRARRGRTVVTVLAMVMHTAAVVAIGIVAFEALWGLNYRRATVSARVDFSEARVTDAAVARFSERIVDTLNANVAAAHAESVDRAKLRAAFEPLIQRLGDGWQVDVTAPKPTLLDPYFEAAGIGGSYSPFAFETLLNGSFLPFEVPRALAHEWAHVGGFTDEGDANYIGTLTCLRSGDPLIRYSGAFWTYGELPEAQRKRLRLDPRVIADFQASRERFYRYYKPRIFAFQWHFYDRFLRSNGVRRGVASYGFFLKLLVGTPLDAQGLPLVRAPRG